MVELNLEATHLMDVLRIPRDREVIIEKAVLSHFVSSIIITPDHGIGEALKNILEVCKSDNEIAAAMHLTGQAVTITSEHVNRMKRFMPPFGPGALAMEFELGGKTRSGHLQELIDLFEKLSKQPKS